MNSIGATANRLGGNNQLNDIPRYQLTNGSSSQFRSQDTSSAFDELRAFTQQHEYVVLNKDGKGSFVSTPTAPLLHRDGERSKKKMKSSIRAKRRLSTDSPANWLGHMTGSNVHLAAANSPVLLVSPKRD